MARITFQKRQKEMKRLEKQKAKAERRAQKKLEKPADQEDSGLDPTILTRQEAQDLYLGTPPDSEPQN
jgi:hypothetical protein